MEIAVTNVKFFRQWDGTDNDCCWQIERIGEDIEEILNAHSIPYEAMYEDWGLGIVWTDEGTEYSLLVTCIDVEKAAYKVLFEAFGKRFVVLKRLIPIEQTPFAYLAEELIRLGA